MDQPIVSDPRVMMGKPVLAGTRITVESILERLAAGESLEAIATSHPRVTLDAVRAAVAFAAESMKAEVVHAAPGATP